MTLLYLFFEKFLILKIKWGQIYFWTPCILLMTIIWYINKSLQLLSRIIPTNPSYFPHLRKLLRMFMFKGKYSEQQYLVMFIYKWKSSVSHSISIPFPYCDCCTEIFTSRVSFLSSIYFQTVLVYHKEIQGPLNRIIMREIFGASLEVSFNLC